MKSKGEFLDTRRKEAFLNIRRKNMKIKAEDTAALIIDFQEKLVPAIADHG